MHLTLSELRGLPGAHIERPAGVPEAIRQK